MGTRSVQWWVLAVALLGALPGAAGEVAPAPDPVTVILKDGGRLVGTIVTEDEAAITLRTTSGMELKLLRDAIASVEPARVAANGAPPPPPPDPNETRLMFAPTGRPLGKGDGYFSDHYVLFPGFAYGLTGNLSLSGGVSTIPSLGLDEQVYYVSTQLGWRLSPKAALSFGGLYAAGAEEELDAGVLYGITSLGRPDRSLTLGFGLVSTREEEARLDPRGRYLGSTQRWRSEPVVMVGGTLRVGRRASLVTESWLFLDKPLSEQPFGLALRLFADRISVDVGFVFVPQVIDEGFPIPWLSFSYHFGPSRSAAKRTAPGSMAGLDRWGPSGR
jgi:hypothetical protein